MLDNLRGSKKASVYTGATPDEVHQVITDIIRSAGGSAEAVVATAKISPEANTVIRPRPEM